MRIAMPNSMPRGWLTIGARVAAVVGLLAVAGCRQDMNDQARFDPLEANPFFADGRASRPRVEGTVARGFLKLDDHLYRGTVDGELAETFPFEITMDVMRRGRERYDIYCSVCHDRAGAGLGMVVRRGFQRPPSLHDERLRTSPPGHFFDVMTRGFGAMPDYVEQMSAEDRWAVAAYIRALQLSQRVDAVTLTEADRQAVAEGKTVTDDDHHDDHAGHGHD